MELTLDNYTTALPKELLNHAKKTNVRECDETEKGRFIAYVDEGGDSYDVSLTISNKIIRAHTCDCNTGVPFCRHKAALMLHIAAAKKVKATVKAKKKSKAETLLGEADTDELKEWVHDLLLKNKDLELSFVHYFSARQQQYSPEEVAKLTSDAIKAVAKNKRNIDPTQLKKLVDLWEGIHAPVVRSYLANAGDEKSFLNLHTLLECCLEFQTGINTNSNKIPKYVEGVLQQTAEPVNGIYNEKAWSDATGYFIAYIREGANKVRLHYLLHLKNLIGISSTERKMLLIDRLADQYRKSKPDDLINGGQYTNVLFGIVEENGLIAQYHSLFKPIRFDNLFNEKLIRLLIQNNHLSLAEKYCWQQIQGNYREEYNAPYLKLLKEIYTLQKDDAKLAGILTDLLPGTFDFDDYLFICNHMEEGEEKKKWRTKILTKAKNASSDFRTAGTVFVFRLLDHERSYKKMIDAINSYTPYGLILRYLQPMALADKPRLLKALLNKGENWAWNFDFEEREKDREYIPQLLEALLQHYTAEDLIKAIKALEKERYYHRPDHFVRYIKEKLALAGR